MKKLLLLLLLISSICYANSTNDITVTVGYGPGGTNTITRTFTADAENASQLNFIVEERPGANGSIALKNYLKQAPSNKSIVGVSGGQVLFEALVHPENNFINQLKIIGPVVYSPLAIAIKNNGNGKISSLNDLFDKKIPKQVINIASGGESHDMLIKQIAKYSHHDIQAVRYKGGAEEYTAVMGGHVDAEVDSFGALKQREPSLRIIGVAQPTAIGAVPSINKFAPIPTMVNYFAIAINKDATDIQELIKAITLGFIRSDRVDIYKEQGYSVDLNSNSDYTTRVVDPTYKKWIEILNKSK